MPFPQAYDANSRTEILAFEKVGEGSNNVIMKHPNTGWLLVVHEGGPNAPDKPRLNHYGVRVATNREVDNAREFLLAKQSEYGLVEVDKLQNRHLAHSVHFIEPGGNTWEIESYEMAVKAGLGANVATPWTTPLPSERFGGKGFIPQALTHGTITCLNLEASRRFYQEVLGLEVVSPSRSVPSRYIKHPATPWYIVSLEKPADGAQAAYAYAALYSHCGLCCGCHGGPSLVERVRRKFGRDRTTRPAREQRGGSVSVERSGQKLVGNYQSGFDQLTVNNVGGGRLRPLSVDLQRTQPGRHTPRSR